MSGFVRLNAVCSIALLALAFAPGCAGEQGANPVPFDVANLKTGRQLYAIHCVSCHGVDGRGDTEMREFLKTPPADLTDEFWTYGGEDVQVFDAIKSGRPARDMPGFADSLTDERMWSIVNYLRFLGGKRP